MIDRKVVGYDFVSGGYMVLSSGRALKLAGSTVSSQSAYEKGRRKTAYRAGGKYKS